MANGLAKGLSRLADKRLAAPPIVQRAADRWRRASQAPPSDVVVFETSHAGLRLTRVTRRRGTTPDVQSAFRPIPADLDVAARPLAERKALTALVAELGAAGRPAVAALAGSDVVVRRLTMPIMNPADLRSALELECRRHVNTSMADMEMRYEMIATAASGKEISVLVALAPKHRVEERRALLAAAGLRPWAITVPAVGLRADLERAGSLDARDVVAYLDIGRDSSQIVVLKGRDIRFSRDLAFGRQTMATALCQVVVPGVGTIERTPEAAEALLLASGVPLGAEETRAIDGVPLAAVSVMLRPTLERLVRELWNSFDYCNEQFLGEAVTRVVLRGPGASLRNLGAYLNGVLKMPVEGADLENGVSAARSGQGAEASSGIALAAVSRDTLNFLQGTGGGPGFSWMVDAVPAPAVAVAAAVLIVSIAVPSEVQTIQARQRVAALRGDLEKLASQSAAIAQFRAERADEARLKAIESQLTGSEIVWSNVLRDLSHRVGPDVRLTSVEIVDPAAPAAPSAAPAAPAAPQARSLRVTGLLHTAATPPEGVLAALLRSLGASPHFDVVRLEGCERVAPEMSRFTITARLAEGGATE